MFYSLCKGKVTRPVSINQIFGRKRSAEEAGNRTCVLSSAYQPSAFITTTTRPSRLTQKIFRRDTGGDVYVVDLGLPRVLPVCQRRHFKIDRAECRFQRTRDSVACVTEFALPARRSRPSQHPGLGEIPIEQPTG